MTTIEECRLRASDAHDLSRLATLGSERERLRTESRFWRQQVSRFDQEPPSSAPPKSLAGFIRGLASLAQAPRLQMT